MVNPPCRGPPGKRGLLHCHSDTHRQVTPLRRAGIAGKGSGSPSRERLGAATCDVPLLFLSFRCGSKGEERSITVAERRQVALALVKIEEAGSRDGGGCSLEDVDSCSSTKDASWLGK